MDRKKIEPACAKLMRISASAESSCGRRYGRARSRGEELRMAEQEQVKMADDKTKTGKPDRDRINTSEEYEVRDWAKRLGVSEGELKAAVKKVGPMAADVAKSLGRSL